MFNSVAFWQKNGYAIFRAAVDPSPSAGSHPAHCYRQRISCVVGIGILPH